MSSDFRRRRFCLVSFVVTRDRHVALFLFGADFLQAFFGAEAVVGVAGVQQLLDLFVIDVEAFALEIRTAILFATRTFVPLESKPLQGAHQIVQSGFIIALTVGIFDTQVENATHGLCKEVVVK